MTVAQRLLLTSQLLSSIPIQVEEVQNNTCWQLKGHLVPNAVCMIVSIVLKHRKVDPRLNIKVDSMYDCLNNIFCTAKLSMLHGFTIGVSVDVL